MCPQARVAAAAAALCCLTVSVPAARVMVSDETASANACAAKNPTSGYCSDLAVPAALTRWVDSGPCTKSTGVYIERYIWQGSKLAEFKTHRHVDVEITQTFACKIVGDSCEPEDRDCDGLTLDERVAAKEEERRRSRTGDDICNDPIDNHLVRTWQHRDKDSGVITPCSELRSGATSCFGWCEATGLCESRYKKLLGGDLLIRNFQRECRGIGEKRRELQDRASREAYKMDETERLQALPVCGSNGLKPKQLKPLVKAHGVNTSALIECDISYQHCQCWNCKKCQGEGYDPGEGTVYSWSCTGDKAAWWDGRYCPLERPH